jgi:hypothetical protein
MAVVLLAAVALLCTLHPAPVRADSGPIYFSAGMLVPTTSSDIRMTREVLTIDYTTATARTSDPQDNLIGVHARFWFRNEGKAVTQKMGFPLGREVLNGFGYFDSGFTVTADGATVTTTLFDDQKSTGGTALTYTMWRTFEVPFAAGQTRLVDVTYRICPRGGFFLYVLQTGRLWKGPIGDLSIDVNFGRDPAFPDLLSVQPAGYRTVGNHLVWHFTNEEPEQDIEIESMDPAFWKTVRPLKDAAERTGTEADWYRYAMALLPDNIVGAYSGSDWGAVNAKGFVGGLQTSAYADYVQRTLLTALNHCTQGSTSARILRAAFDARWRYYRGTGDFLNGLAVWDTRASTRAHDIYNGLLLQGMSTANPSADEARLAAWLTANMAGESMAGGYSLNAIHELEQSQALARQAGIGDTTAYQGMLKSVLAMLSPYETPRLLAGVSIVPRIEIQQQKLAYPSGNPVWRARIILHQTLPPSEVSFVWTEPVSAQPDWTKGLAAGDTAEQDNSPATIEYGFSNVDANDYLIIINVPKFSTPGEFQASLQRTVDSYGVNLLDNRRVASAGYDDYYYHPTDARQASSIQFAGYTWLQAIAPALTFSADHGVAIASGSVPMADALCDKADETLKTVGDFFRTLSWAKDYELDKILQHNLDLVTATRGKTPVVTTVTYAADGTVQRTTTSGRSAWNSSLLTSLLCAAAGLVVGLFLPRRGKKHSTQEAA